MKKIGLMLLLCLALTYAKAQQGLAFPFQGGRQVMMDYFKNHITIPQELNKKAASGAVVFKFTADEKGAIKKVIVYYADDLALVQPLIDAIKQSDRKWIIPDGEKLHDFLLPVTITYTSATSSEAAHKAAYNYAVSRKPVISRDQVPLDMVTLLPAVVVNYELRVE